MSAKEWKVVAEGAVEILGKDWVTVGKGRDLFLVPVPIGWWYQYLSYENTSIGRLAATTQFTGQPLQYLLYGDHGMESNRVFIRDHGGRGVISRIDPESTASWTKAVYDRVFAPYRGSSLADKWSTELAQCDRYEGLWDTWVDLPEDNAVRVPVFQVMCGSKPRAGLLATIDRALASLRVHKEPDRRLTDRDPVEYLEAIRTTVAAGDRLGFEAVVLENRVHELTGVGVSESLIGPVEFPSPRIRWWDEDQVDNLEEE